MNSAQLGIWKVLLATAVIFREMCLFIYLFLKHFYYYVIVIQGFYCDTSLYAYIISWFGSSPAL